MQYLIIVSIHLEVVLSMSKLRTTPVAPTCIYIYIWGPLYLYEMCTLIFESVAYTWRNYCSFMCGEQRSSGLCSRSFTRCSKFVRDPNRLLMISDRTQSV